MALILYADFTSPGCYLAAGRAGALASAGVDIDWRAVEHHPKLPVTGRPLGPHDRDVLEERLAKVKAQLLPGERLPVVLPKTLSNTMAAVSAFAEAYGAGAAGDVRRLLFRLYWVDGVDISDPRALWPRLAGPFLRCRTAADPLRESGFAISVSRGPITDDAWRRIRTWRAEWIRAGAPDLPVLRTAGAAPLAGEAALRRLAEEIVRTGAALGSGRGDPARYPAAPTHPSRTWVSQIGGSWSHVWKTGT